MLELLKKISKKELCLLLWNKSDRNHYNKLAVRIRNDNVKFTTDELRELIDFIEPTYHALKYELHKNHINKK